MRLADLVKARGVFGEEIGFQIDSGADAFLLQIRALNRVGDDPEHGTRCVELGLEQSDRRVEWWEEGLVPD
jgi:hypothetical protein